MKKDISAYVKDIVAEHKAGETSEHSYRPHLVNFFNSVLKKGVRVTNEPKQRAGKKPDMNFRRKGIPFGHLEAKDVHIDLNTAEKSKQLKGYLEKFPNLILTNQLEFRLYRDKKEIRRVEVAKLAGDKIKLLPENYETFANLVSLFEKHKSFISSADDLAEFMADMAVALRDKIKEALEEDKGKDENGANENFADQMGIFEKYLIHDLNDDAFADMYAQTLVYGMLAARMYDPNDKGFTRQKAGELIPKSNPFLRNFFDYIAGSKLDERIAPLVEELAEMFDAANVHSLMEQVAQTDRQDKKIDPFMHFYETFLKAYDPKLRRIRGVYYTPDSVVDFIVRAVDDILEQEFGLKGGLAYKEKFWHKREVYLDEKGEEVDVDADVKKEKVEKKEHIHCVQILDPATGTGTFLAAIVEHIYNDPLIKDQRGTWRDYVKDELIPRLHGFEYLMAPYAIAHAKLRMVLREKEGLTDADENERLQIFLTNSLEDRSKAPAEFDLGRWLKYEAKEADRVKKDKPIMVIIGNPPYNARSANKGDWITKLVKEYKRVDGKHFREQKHWLQDDYVKFIRMGEAYIERAEQGVLAYICNHAFLDNPTFRGMRQHLLRTFDKIYVLNLHGNSKKKEVAPDGSKDENVFDIQQGVSINLFIKTGKKKKNELGKVCHKDVYGKRMDKYQFLLRNAMQNIKWNSLAPISPSYYFIPTDMSKHDSYILGFSLKDAFTKRVSGIVTAKDKFTIYFTPEELRNATTRFMKLNNEEAREEFKLGDDGRNWSVAGARRDLKENVFDKKKEDKPTLIAYRPFDERYTYYTGTTSGFSSWPRRELMRHFLAGENIGIILHKREEIVGPFAHVFVSRHITEHGITSGKTTNYQAPLYLYPEDDLVQKANGSSGREPNLNEKIVERIAQKIGLRFTAEPNRDSKCFSPYNLLDYIYAVLHSPTYREEYVEFLKYDFPRVPYPEDAKTFRALANLGSKIRKLHLMEEVPEPKVGYPKKGNHEVKKINFDPKDGGKVFINSKQYFSNVPEKAWEFRIGAYQPAQKWLKDRKGRCLTKNEIKHYRKIIAVLIETDRLMQEIDKTWKP